MMNLIKLNTNVNKSEKTMMTIKKGTTSMKRKLSRSALLLAMTSLPLSALAAFDVASLKVNASGVYELGFDYLAANGVDLRDTDLSRLGLRSQGSAVPIEIIDNGNGTADFGDAIRFIGEGVNTLYTDTRVYTLSLDGDAARMSSHDAAIPAGASAPSYTAVRSFAPQSVYSLTSPAADPWYATHLLSYLEPAEQSVTLSMDNYVSSAGSPQLNVKLWGDSDLDGAGNDHHVEIYVNNSKVADTVFDGIIEHEVNQSLNANMSSGNATIKVKVPGDQGFLFDIVNIDEINLSYPRRFVADNGTALEFDSHWSKYRIRGLASADVSVYAQDSAGNVSRINNVIAGGSCSSASPNCEAMFGGIGQATYLVATPSAIKTPTLDIPLALVNIDTASDVVVISHPSFIDLTGQPLEAYVAQLSSENAGGASLVDVEQIYAQYSAGEFGADAISAYIKAAHARGAKSVVLVGGDVFDYHDYKNTSATSFIPSIYVATNHIVRFTPVDPKYADVDGDNVPDLIIARLPIRTPAELNAMLNKRNAYVNNSYNGKAVFAADKTNAIDQFDFGADNNAYISDHFGGWNVTKAYIDEIGADAANQVISDKINAGTALVAYSGHSSADQLSFYGLFDGADAAGLNNVGSPTIVTQWGCWNTYNVNPDSDSMSHKLLLSGEQGAAAVLGSSVITKAGAEKILADLFYAELTSGKNIGEALLLAKQAYAQGNGADLDVLLGVTEMGFPGLTVQ